jgi:oligopeptide/dipeptide ABC transporter ATP-binding protein
MKTERKSPLLQVENLQIHFPTGRSGQTVKAVNGISFEVREGETFGVIGESGSGKTTLGRALVSLIQPTAGTILQGGVDPSQLSRQALQSHRRQYQIIFQDPNSALNPRMKVIDAVMEPLKAAGRRDTDAMQKIALDALARVGLTAEHAERYPHQFSGGQKQRIIIARALTLRPRVLVCDEVVAALDVSIRGDVLNLFAELQREFGLTYVFITHDLSVVSHISDRIAVMYLGCMMELASAQVLAERPLHPYTQALLSAEPLPLPSHMRTDRQIVLKGEIPSPMNPPAGCPFSTRCPHVQNLCTSDKPAWREIEPDHWVACHFAQVQGVLHA